MSATEKPSSGGHLDYYIKHAISPVRYAMDDFEAHLDRRDSLYRSLGLPPVAFKGADVLEIAPGSGQNSLYLATCNPASLTLVEPNPAGRDDIAAAYKSVSVPHTEPTLVPKTLQDFNPERQYDIVICENWLGALPSEVTLIQKLASLVAPGGVLVLTYVPLAGFFPNVMRKLLAMRVVSEEQDFETNTAALVEVFGPHLETIANMTRSHRDWVHDCMINPHYLNVGLPLKTVLDAIGGEMEALATFPRFATDWRWFKGLTGEARKFNPHILDAEAAQLLTFIDYRRTFAASGGEPYHELNAAFDTLHRLALAWQAASEAGDLNDVTDITRQIGIHLKDLKARFEAIDTELSGAISELCAVWLNPSLTAEEVRDMPTFGKLFGRETVYLSLTRPRSV